jgi:hypothetical protein
MGLRERIKNVVKAGLAFVEAMEAGSSGYDEYRIGSLERRVVDIEKSLRLNAASPSNKDSTPSPELVE